MTFARMLPVSLAIAMLAALAHPAAAQTYPPTKVAICNPARVFVEIQETKDLTAKFESDAAALNREKEEREVRIRDARTNRDQLKPDAPGWNDRNQELLRLALEYEVWQRITAANLENQRKLQMKGIFDRITTSVAQIASQRGIDLVVAEVRPEVDNLEQINLNDLRARLTQRNVLYNAAQADITNDVIAAMDAAYKAGR